MNKLISRWLWHFDRIFGNNKKAFWQIVIILVMILLLVAFIGLGGFLANTLNFKNDFCKEVIQSIGLAFGASNLPPGGEGKLVFPLWWQTIAFLLGAVFFSGVTITFVGNWLSNRQKAYRNGTVRYSFFENHLLFLGSSRIILPMLKMIGEDEKLRCQYIVVLTADDIKRVRIDINRTLTSNKQKSMRITVLSGDHFDEDTLKSVCAGMAQKLYIIGDHLSGSEHDSENVACWEAVRSLCSNRTKVPCVLYFSRTSSTQLFYHRNKTEEKHLDTTVLNFLETVAQRVLVHNGTEKNNIYPRLDRNGIGPEDNRKVHLVVTGATSASYAIATTAAHLCHFPNSINPITFDIIPSRRTKITFIAPKIKEEMSFITGHLLPLFRMSHYTYVSKTDSVVNEEPNSLDDRFGDFLDIEWEFIDGSTADLWVIKRLKDYYNDSIEKKNTFLTMAFCEMDADRNIAAATYLPSEFHKIVFDDKGNVDYEQTIPLFVFQPKNERLVHNANKETAYYRNMFSFGSQHESYDSSIRQHIEEGKFINHIYCKGDDYQYRTTNKEKLDYEWSKLSFLDQKSNIYCANHIGMKLRSMGMGSKTLLRGERIPERYVELMSVVEHNRWNMEKLLMGYEPMERSKRLELKNYEKTHGNLTNEDKKEIKDLKTKHYIHNCIAPFNELLEESKKYDYLIVRNLTDVIQ